MNCGKHRRPSIRRPTAARQRYEQSRLSEKPKPHATATFAQLSAVRRRKSDRKRQPRGKTSPQRRKDRQARAVPPKNGFSPLPAHSGDPHRTLPAFSRKNKLLSGKEPTIHAAHSGKIQTIKGLRTQPTAGSVPARRKRLLRKPNLRSPPFPATDSPRSGPDRQPPQLLPQPPQPALPASEFVRFSPNEGKRDHNVLFGGAATRISLRRKDLRESRHYRHGLRPRTNDRRMTDIEIYDCRGNPSFSGTGSKQKTNPPINRRFSVFNGPFRRREQNRPLWYIRTILRSIQALKIHPFVKEFATLRPDPSANRLFSTLNRPFRRREESTLMVYSNDFTGYFRH